MSAPAHLVLLALGLKCASCGGTAVLDDGPVGIRGPAGERACRDAGRIQPLVLVDGFSAEYIALDVDHVYWSAEDGSEVRIFRVEKTGGVPEVLASYAAGASGHARAVAVDDRHVYTEVDAPDGSTGMVVRLPKAGGAVETVVDASVADVLVDGNYVYLSSPNLHDLPGDYDHLVRVSKASGEITALASGQHWMTQLLLDDAYVYFQTIESGGNDGCVKRVLKSGGPTELIAELELRGPVPGRPMALCQDQLYLTNAGGPAELWRVARDGGGPERVLTLDSGPRAVASDGSSIYIAGDSTLTGIVEFDPRRAELRTLGRSVPPFWPELNDVAVDEVAVYATSRVSGPPAGVVFVCK